MRAIIWKDLKERRWIILSVMLIFVGIAFMTFGMYHTTINSYKALLEKPSNLSPAQIDSMKKNIILMKNFGYYMLTSWYEGLGIFIMIFFFAVLGESIFGKENKKTLDFLFTRPISYGKILISKFIAGFIAITLGIVVPLIAVPIISSISGKKIDMMIFLHALVPYIIGFLALFAITVFISILTRFKRWISALISIGLFTFWSSFKDIFYQTWAKSIDFNTLFLNAKAYMTGNFGGYLPFTIGIGTIVIMIVSSWFLIEKKSML